MKSKKTLCKVIDEIYVQLFKEADPPADIYEIAKSGEGKKQSWFLKYYLDMDRQVEIVDEICKKYKLNKRESYIISKNIHLGFAPGTVPIKKYKNRCPECGQFCGKANPKLLKIAHMKAGYFCEWCDTLIEGED